MLLLYFQPPGIKRGVQTAAITDTFSHVTRSKLNRLEGSWRSCDAAGKIKKLVRSNAAQGQIRFLEYGDGLGSSARDLVWEKYEGLGLTWATCVMQRRPKHRQSRGLINLSHSQAPLLLLKRAQIKAVSESFPQVSQYFKDAYSGLAPRKHPTLTELAKLDFKVWEKVWNWSVSQKNSSFVRNVLFMWTISSEIQ